MSLRDPIKIPIAVLKVGETRSVRTDLEFPEAPVTFKLIQGNGPVHIHGQHLPGAVVEEIEDYGEEMEEEILDEEDAVSVLKILLFFRNCKLITNFSFTNRMKKTMTMPTLKRKPNCRIMQKELLVVKRFKMLKIPKRNKFDYQFHIILVLNAGIQASIKSCHNFHSKTELK